MQIPGGHLGRVLGHKKTLTIAAVLWSVLTASTVLAADHSFGMLLAIRFLLGLAEGVTYPCVYVSLPTFRSAYPRWTHICQWHSANLHCTGCQNCACTSTHANARACDRIGVLVLVLVIVLVLVLVLHADVHVGVAIEVWMPVWMSVLMLLAGVDAGADAGVAAAYGVPCAGTDLFLAGYPKPSVAVVSQSSWQAPPSAPPLPSWSAQVRCSTIPIKITWEIIAPAQQNNPK